MTTTTAPAPAPARALSIDGLLLAAADHIQRYGLERHDLMSPGRPLADAARAPMDVIGAINHAATGRPWGRSDLAAAGHTVMIRWVRRHTRTQIGLTQWVTDLDRSVPEILDGLRAAAFEVAAVRAAGQRRLPERVRNAVAALGEHDPKAGALVDAAVTGATDPETGLSALKDHPLPNRLHVARETVAGFLRDHAAGVTR